MREVGDEDSGANKSWNRWGEGHRKIFDGGG